LKRFHPWAAWLAIVALLIDALSPTAIAAAARPDTAAPFALCSGAAGVPQPGKPVPTLPSRHCALCIGGSMAGLLPTRHGGLVVRVLAGAAHPAVALSSGSPIRRPDYAAAQPRAPPLAV
jgi:hypothetical protein